MRFFWFWAIVSLWLAFVGVIVGAGVLFIDSWMVFGLACWVVAEVQMGSHHDR